MRTERLTLTPKQYQQSLPEAMTGCSVCSANHAEARDTQQLLVIPVIDGRTQWRAAMLASRAHRKRKGDERNGSNT